MWFIELAPLTEQDFVRILAEHQVEPPVHVGGEHPAEGAVAPAVAALQRDASARVDVIFASGRGLPMQATYRFEPDGLRYTVIPSRVGRGAAPTPGKQA